MSSRLSPLPKVIAICGSKRTGKDTVADIASKFGYEKRKIAGPLKSVVAKLFDFTDDQLENDDKDAIDPRWNVTPRSLMQFFGTEIMQFEIQKVLPGIGREFWVRKLFQEREMGKIVISDVRFQHEVDVIARETRGDFLLLRISRESLEPPREPLEARREPREHVSETSASCIQGVHYEIENNGTIENLASKVMCILQKFSS